MGEKWVLANGAIYTYNEYPYLWEFYKQEELTGKWFESNSTIFSTTDSNNSVVKSKKLNNKNIILKPKSIVVVNSINGIEINYNEYTVTTETDCYISDIDYGNGYYVAVCSASYKEFVYVSTDLISWTKYQVNLPIERQYPALDDNIFFKNNKWYLAYSCYNPDNELYPVYLLTASDPTSTWKSYKVSEENDCRAFCVTDNYVFVCTCYASSSSSYYNIYRSPISKISFSKVYAGSGTTCDTIYYYNGYLLMSGYNTGTTGSNSKKGFIYYSSDNGKTWTECLSTSESYSYKFFDVNNKLFAWHQSMYSNALWYYSDNGISYTPLQSLGTMKSSSCIIYQDMSYLVNKNSTAAINSSALFDILTLDMSDEVYKYIRALP